MAKSFQDHFSKHAASYGAFRPTYPEELADWLAKESPARELAWDCGCGSGQFSLLLAQRFLRVLGTDASAEQVALGKPHPRIEYAVARVEDPPLAVRAVDLVVAAQAAHWFDLPRWFETIERVSKRGGLVAMITYPKAILVDAKLNEVLAEFYDVGLAGHWPPERVHVENEYRDLPFPFKELAAPPFTIRSTQRLADFLGYVDTWSSIRSLERAGMREVYQSFATRFAKAGGGLETMVDVRFPIAMRVGRVT